MTHRPWKAFAAGFAVLLLTGTLVLAHGNGKGRTKIDFRLMLGDPSSSRLFLKLDVSAAISSNANILMVDPPKGHASKHNGKGHGKGKGNANAQDDRKGNDNGQGNDDGNGKHGNGNEGDDNDDDDDDDDNGGITSNGNVGHGKHGKSGNFALAGSTVTLSIGSATFSGTADANGRVRTPFDAKLTANGAILQIQANGLNLEELFPIDPTDGQHQVTVELKVTAATAATATAASQTITLSDQNVTLFYVVKNGRARGRNF